MGLPTIHCFKRLEATSGATSGLYCRPSHRRVAERFFHFLSSISSAVPVMPTSSPLSPDEMLRRKALSTVPGNRPTSAAGVLFSPSPRHRTEARSLCGYVRATAIRPKAVSVVPPRGHRRQTPPSPGGERANPDRLLRANRSVRPPSLRP